MNGGCKAGWWIYQNVSYVIFIKIFFLNIDVVFLLCSLIRRIYIFYLLLWKNIYLCVIVGMFSRIIIFLDQVNYCKSKYNSFRIVFLSMWGNMLKGLRLYTGYLLTPQCYLTYIYFRVKCDDLGFLNFSQMICESLKIIVLSRKWYIHDFT